MQLKNLCEMYLCDYKFIDAKLYLILGASEFSSPSLRPDDPSTTVSAELRIPASAARPVLQMPPMPPVNTA